MSGIVRSQEHARILPIRKKIFKRSELKSSDIFAIIFLAIFLVIFARYFWLWPGLVDVGDRFSDSRVLIASQNWQRYGLNSFRYLPCHSVVCEKPAPNHYWTPMKEDNSGLYTHYPPLPEWLNYIQAKVFGGDKLFNFRLVSLFCSVCGLLIWYAFARRAIGPLIGIVSLIFIAFTPTFFQDAGSVHQSAYLFLIETMCLYAIWRLWEISPKRAGDAALKKSISRPILWGMVFWLGYFTMVWLSFQTIVSTAFYMIFFHRILKGRWWNSSFLLFIAAPILAAITRVALNAWALGSLSVAIHDLIGSATDYATGMVSTDSKAPYWLMYLKALSSLIAWSGLGHPFIMIGLLMVMWFGHRHVMPELGSHLKWFWPLFGTLFLAPATWWIIMPGHIIPHYWLLARHLVFFSAILRAMYFLLGFRWVTSKDNRLPLRVGGVLLILLSILITFPQGTYGMLPRAVLGHPMDKYYFHQAEGLEVLCNISKQLPPDIQLFSNVEFYGVMSWSCGRHILDESSLYQYGYDSIIAYKPAVILWQVKHRLAQNEEIIRQLIQLECSENDLRKHLSFPGRFLLITLGKQPAYKIVR